MRPIWYPLSLTRSTNRSFTIFPDISEEERIRVSLPKIKKHPTKHRGNKLHDKKHARRPR